MKRFVILSILCFGIMVLLTVGNGNDAETDKTVIDTRIDIASVVFSPDGRFLSSWQEDGSNIITWDTYLSTPLVVS